MVLGSTPFLATVSFSCPSSLHFGIISFTRLFLSLVPQVTSGVTEASYWKPQVLSPAVKQEAALDSAFPY